MEGMEEVPLAKASSEVFGGTRIGEDVALVISRVFISCNHMGCLACDSKLLCKKEKCLVARNESRTIENLLNVLPPL